MASSTTILAPLLGALLLGACAATITATPETKPIPAERVALHADKAVPAEIAAAFRGEISERYPSDVGQDAVVADLIDQGFICEDLGVYPQVQPGGTLTQCELPKPHGLCSDKWTVALRLKRVTRQISFHRVGVEGNFERFCVAGASPNG